MEQKKRWFKNFVFLLILIIFTLSLTVNYSFAERNNTIEVECGNNICELGENEDNCPNDCARSRFNYNTNLVDSKFGRGEVRDYFLEVQNNMEGGLSIGISVSGEISKFIKLEDRKLSIPPKEEKRIDVRVEIPEDLEPSSYNGNLILEENGNKDSLPLRFEVTSKGIPKPELEVKSLDESVGRSENTILYVEWVSDYVLQKNITFNYYLGIDEGNFTDIFIKKETYNFTTPLKFVKQFNINPLIENRTQRVEKQFYIKVITDYGKGNVSGVGTFKLKRPFWTKDRILKLVLSLVGLVLIILSVYGVYKFRKWRKSKARYLFPTDYKLLPRKSDRALWVGKIAGTKKNAWLNSDDLLTHVLTAGATGSGKSVSASVIVEEVLNKKIPVVVFDPTAQWTGFVKSCNDNNLLSLYKKFGMKKQDAHPFKGLIYDVDTPSIKPDFKKYMIPGEVTIFNLKKLKPGQYDTAVKNIVQTIFNQQWEEATHLRMLVVFDEVHRLLEKYGGKGGYIALEKACREFRKWGIGVMMASQVNADFKEAVQGNILTEVQLNTKAIEDINKMDRKYGNEYAKRISGESVGVGMIQHPRYNKGKPWFVNFRPTLHSPHKISEEDLKKYREYTDQLDKIEEKIEGLKKKGKDVTDTKLELKLARDKLSQGHFKMAKIYLDSLEESFNKNSR